MSCANGTAMDNLSASLDKRDGSDASPYLCRTRPGHSSGVLADLK